MRVAAHAFGESRPARDLFVSPGHAICVDILGEVLIPAVALVNGATIQQVEVDAVTYWHVELDSHDILFAENLACESYLDMGNRGFFQEADVVDLDADPDAAGAQRTHADFCCPFVETGPLLNAVRAQLRRRAATLGWRLRANGLGDLHLVVDGTRIEPDVAGLAARFVVPATARTAWLVSDVARPCDVIGTADARDLGICVRRLTIDDGRAVHREIGAADERLRVGFHGCEDGARRWTAGRALLPAELWADVAGPFVLRLDLADAALPRWVAPDEDVSVETARPQLPAVA